MKSYKVKNLMVPLTEYATVPENATLFVAVKALEASQKSFTQDCFLHRAVLAYDKNNKIFGAKLKTKVFSLRLFRRFKKQMNVLEKQFNV